MPHEEAPSETKAPQSAPEEQQQFQVGEVRKGLDHQVEPFFGLIAAQADEVDGPEVQPLSAQTPSPQPPPPPSEH